MPFSIGWSGSVPEKETQEQRSEEREEPALQVSGEEQVQRPQVAAMRGVFEKQQESQWGWSRMSKWETARVQILGAW